MHIATLAQILVPGDVYRCDSLPPGRGFVKTLFGPHLYVRADGTFEPFDWKSNPHYNRDETWVKLGRVRFLRSGEIDASSFSEILA